VRTGRLYLTTNYICYYSSVMGFNTKIVVPWLDIMNVDKDGTSGILIRVVKKEPDGKEKKYVFSAFQQRDTSFKYIHRLWCNSSPFAVGAKDDAEG
jgi:GRAM domain